MLRPESRGLPQSIKGLEEFIDVGLAPWDFQSFWLPHVRWFVDVSIEERLNRINHMRMPPMLDCKCQHDEKGLSVDDLRCKLSSFGLTMATNNNPAFLPSRERGPIGADFLGEDSLSRQDAGTAWHFVWWDKLPDTLRLHAGHLLLDGCPKLGVCKCRFDSLGHTRRRSNNGHVNSMPILNAIAPAGHQPGTYFSCPLSLPVCVSICASREWPLPGT